MGAQRDRQGRARWHAERDQCGRGGRLVGAEPPGATAATCAAMVTAVTRMAARTEIGVPARAATWWTTTASASHDVTVMAMARAPGSRMPPWSRASRLSHHTAAPPATARPPGRGHHDRAASWRRRELPPGRSRPPRPRRLPATPRSTPWRPARDVGSPDDAGHAQCFAQPQRQEVIGAGRDVDGCQRLSERQPGEGAHPGTGAQHEGGEVAGCHHCHGPGIAHGRRPRSWPAPRCRRWTTPRRARAGHATPAHQAMARRSSPVIRPASGVRGWRRSGAGRLDPSACG